MLEHMMNKMNISKLELNKVTEFQDIILSMKIMGLIKDKSRQRQFHNNAGKIYYE